MQIKWDRDVAWCMVAAMLIGNLLCALIYLPDWY